MSAQPSGMVLNPGVFLIELRADPTVTVSPATLRQALEQAGFTNILLDEDDVVPVPPVAVGASPGAFALPKASAPAPAAALAALHAARTSAPLSAAAAMAMKPAPTPSAPTTPGAARVQAALRSPAATSIARTTTTSTVKAQTAAQQMAAAQAKKTGNPFSNPFAGPQGAGGGGEGGGVDQGPGSGGDITFTPDPSDDRYANASDGNRYYLDPDTGVVYLVDKDGSLESVDQQTLKPTGQHYPAPPPLAAAGGGAASSGDGGGGGGASDAGGADAGPVPTQADLGGGPIDASTAALIAQGGDVEKAYGEDPAFSLHVGASAPGGEIHRLVARAPSSITLRGAPGLMWSARPLSVDPYVEPPLPLTTKPFPLTTGSSYEAIVLSRDRRARSRGDVWTLAEAIGLEPQAICLLARDLHLPRRSGSYSRWLLVGTWRGPATVTTAEEPLLFADVARTG